MFRRKRHIFGGLTRKKMSELANIGTGYYDQQKVGMSRIFLINLSRSMHLLMKYILLVDATKWVNYALYLCFCVRCLETGD